ncbi:MAG: lipopolysaccharide transport periplasmic protein LptA [Thermodesulfobacteriota bacterium]
MSRKSLSLLAPLFCLFCAATAMAFSTEKSDQPIHVVADRLEVDNKAQMANFIGNVKAVQGDVTINSDSLEVHYDRDAVEAAPAKPKSGEAESQGLMDGGGKVRKVVAIGHVKVVQKDRVAVGRTATYWAGARKILLEGEATVWRGKNQVSGEQITVFLDDDRSIVHGKPGKRVAVTIIPEQGPEGQAGAAKTAPAGGKK